MGPSGSHLRDSDMEWGGASELQVISSGDYYRKPVILCDVTTILEPTNRKSQCF